MIYNGQLPEKVAFQVLKVFRHLNLTRKDGTYSNCAVLKFKPNLNLKFYADANFQKLTPEDIDEMNTSIGNEKWYGVSDGLIGTYAVTRIIPESELSTGGYEIFDGMYNVSVNYIFNDLCILHIPLESPLTID